MAVKTPSLHRHRGAFRRLSGLIEPPAPEEVQMLEPAVAESGCVPALPFAAETQGGLLRLSDSETDRHRGLKS